MSDTDTSRRIPEAPDRGRLAEALTVDQSELTVSPGDVLGWKPGKKLVIARPVDYEAYFAGIGGFPVEGESPSPSPGVGSTNPLSASCSSIPIPSSNCRAHWSPSWT